MRISAFTGKRDNHPQTVELSWTQLREILSADRTAPCTVANCVKSECPHKDGPAWSPATYLPGTTRGNANVESVEIFTIDLDHASDADVARAGQRLAELGLEYIAHTTHSDRDGERAVRLLIPLSEPVAAADWPRFWRTTVAHIGIANDRQVKDAARLYFLPSHPQDRTPFFAAVPGAPLSTAAILAQSPPAPPPPAELPPSPAGGAPASPAVLQAARERLIRHGPAVQGQGGDGHTYQVGAILFRGFGLTFEEAWPLAEEWNASCQPPWAPEELAEKLRNGATYAQGLEGAERAVVEAKQALAAILPPAPELTPWESMLVQARSDVAGALSVAALERAPEPLFVPSSALHSKIYLPTPWLADGLITEGALLVLGGEPKISKTWALTELAIAVATGTPAFGEFATKRRRVAYFYAEDLDRQVRNRQRALLAARGLGVDALDGLFVQPRGKFLDVLNDDDLALVVASVRRIGDVGLLILEPLRDLHGGEEDSSDSMRDVMRRLRLLGELLGCTVGVAHHTAKASVDAGKRRQGQRLRGSGAIHGSVDCGIYLGDLTGDGRNEFGCSVQSEVKGARSAGYFALTLRVEDDAGGEAVRAGWTYSKEPLKSDVAKEDDAWVLACAVKATTSGRATVTSERQLRDLCHPVPDKPRARDAIKRLLSSGALIHAVGTDEWGRALKGIAPATRGEG